MRPRQLALRMGLAPQCAQPRVELHHARPSNDQGASMTTYTVIAGHNGVEPWTLVASQVDTVNFTDDIDRIEVISDGAAEVRFTLDGSTPAVGTAGASTKAWRLPAGTVSTQTLPMPRDKSDTNSIKIVSSGTATVSVNRLFS